MSAAGDCALVARGCRADGDDFPDACDICTHAGSRSVLRVPAFRRPALAATGAGIIAAEMRGVAFLSAGTMSGKATRFARCGLDASLLLTGRDEPDGC